MTCIHHYSFMQSIFTALKICYDLPTHSFLFTRSTQLLTTTFYLTFPECYRVGMIQCEAFSESTFYFSSFYYFLSQTLFKFKVWVLGRPGQSHSEHSWWGIYIKKKTGEHKGSSMARNSPPTLPSVETALSVKMLKFPVKIQTQYLKG